MAFPIDPPGCRCSEAERYTVAPDRAPSDPHAEKISGRAQLKDIGPELATVSVGEVFHRQFDNRRQVAVSIEWSPRFGCGTRT